MGRLYESSTNKVIDFIKVPPAEKAANGAKKRISTKLVDNYFGENFTV